MGLFSRNKTKMQDSKESNAVLRMVSELGNGFFAWDGQLYKSDIIRSCMRPRTRAIGKSVGKHIRENEKGVVTNPDAYMKFLLEEPNPYMTGQVMQEKLANQLALNNNAFALIIRNEVDMPCAIYPIPCTRVKKIYSSTGELYLEFQYLNGKHGTFPYSDIIHIREDFKDDDIFGESPVNSLVSLMDIIVTTDQGIVKAVKNGGVIRWLLSFNSAMRPEDIKKNVNDFVKNYLDIESDSFGAAGVDAKATAKQIEPHDYVPNALQMEKSMDRVFSFFNTNKDIVQSSFNEDQWISYYESCIEPVLMQLSGEYTRKLFTRKQRGFGNKVVFTSDSLIYASMKTKLQLVQFIDRGTMNNNEVRALLNMSPTEHGDEFIRRLDTMPIDGNKNE